MNPALIPALEALAEVAATIAQKLTAGHITEAEAAEQSRAAVASFTAALDASDAMFAKRDAETDAALDAIDAAKRAGVEVHKSIPSPVPSLLEGGDKTGGDLT